MQMTIPKGTHTDLRFNSHHRQKLVNSTDSYIKHSTAIFPFLKSKNLKIQVDPSHPPLFPNEM